MIRSNDIFTSQQNIPFSGTSFESMYMNSRHTENRIYADEEVVLLPLTQPSHTHYNEWKVRSRSAFKLYNYFGNKNKGLFILDVGCGNGWLSAKLSELEGSTIMGIDINKVELSQAKRVFGEKPNLHFTEGRLQNIRYDIKFDVIIFAASIQYFPFFDKVIEDALSHLKPSGEIHIIDSHFYYSRDLEYAKQRSRLYYESIGCGDMTEFYYHHSFDSLKCFQFKLLFNPLSIRNRLFSKNSPFPWIRISAI